MSVDFTDYGRRMEKALDHLAEEFGAVRAGRANARFLIALLWNIMAVRHL